MDREGSCDKVTLEQNKGAKPCRCLRKDHLGRGPGRYKGHEVEVCLVFSGKGKGAKVNRVVWARRKVTETRIKRGDREQVPKRKKFEFNVIDMESFGPKNDIIGLLFRKDHTDCCMRIDCKGVRVEAWRQSNRPSKGGLERKSWRCWKWSDSVSWYR